jgi:hypothetical protein
MQKFLNTIWGTYLKVLVSAVLTTISLKLGQGHDITTLSAKQWLFTCLVPVLPIIVNWINPEDKRYGVGSEN